MLTKPLPIAMRLNHLTLVLAYVLRSTTVLSDNEPPPANDRQLAGDTGRSSARFVVGISPFLDKSMKDEVFRSLVRIMVEDLPLNSNLSVYDAFELKSITQVAVPSLRA